MRDEKEQRTETSHTLQWDYAFRFAQRCIETPQGPCRRVYAHGMTALEIDDLARHWILYQEAWERGGGPCRECTQLQWAYNLVDDLVVDRPEESWQLLLAVRRFDKT